MMTPPQTAVETENGLRGHEPDAEALVDAEEAVEALVRGREHGFDGARRHDLDLVDRVPFNRETLPEVAVDFTELIAAEYPNVLTMAQLASQGRDAVPVEFEFGLDFILVGLERRLRSA